MATLTGPMFSLKASGTLADALTYRTNGRRSSVGKKNIPANPRSDSQIRRRAMTKWLTQTWRQLNWWDQDNFNQLAESWNISPYHAWLKFNSDRWSANLMPAYMFPITLENTPTIVEKSYVQTGLRYDFWIKFMPGTPLGLSLKIAWKNNPTQAWEDNKVVVILGPSTDLTGPFAEIRGYWQAPREAWNNFRGKLGSDTGGMSTDFKIDEVP